MNSEPLLTGPSAAASAPAPLRSSALPPQRRSRWPMWLLLTLLLAVALVIGGLLAIGHVDLAPVSIVVDGEEVLNQWQIAEMPPAHRVLLAGVMLLALLAALVIVPVALLVGVAALAVLLVVLVGIPLVAVAFVVALLCSPLLLLGWLVWKIFT